MEIHARYYFLWLVFYFGTEQVPEIDGTSDKGEVPVSLDGDIDFVGVDFAYPTREEVKVKDAWLCAWNISSTNITVVLC